MRVGIQILALFALCTVPLAGQHPTTGPATEKRFPPLKLPPEFKATLFACDPFIEYPSAIALGPRPGTLFVAIDYMTGLGTEIIRRDEIRLLEDTDGDGYADKATVFATGFNSIQGLAYHDGVVYVMHAPFLTALRDTDGDGKAVQRKDLVTGLGLPPEKNPVRLHCANGVVVGYDGWLYLALGDHGCDVVRPEGDRLVIEGGGILRCRPDGRDLHVFATGLRNIYDIALDDELNVFVRDNENDGGDYMIRLCHSFFGADHGYPYLYYERPDEALPPLADLGLGSSAGGVCYREPAFPREYRGNLFWCEWGRAVMRSRPVRAGSGFAPLKETDFAAAAANDPYGFKPTDLVVGWDGELFVSDWADGQRPKRGRGRIYRITSTKASTASAKPPERPSLQQALAQLDSPSAHRRLVAQEALHRLGPKRLDGVTQALRQKQLGAHGRLHAVWLLARLGGAESIADLRTILETDGDARVQAQAVRALADLGDPVLVQHRLAAKVGSAALARHLADLAAKRDPLVFREIVIALGRLGWPDLPAWLRTQDLSRADAALAHAAMQALRSSGNWPALLELLDLPDAEPIRALALRALADRYEALVVDGVIDRLGREANAARRRVYADWLTRVYKKPGPWVYWGYRPPPRPAPTMAWDRTKAIAQALDRALADPDPIVRVETLRRMRREKIPTRLATLGRWLRDDHDRLRVAAILESVRDHPAQSRRDILSEVVLERTHEVGNRLTALKMLGASSPAVLLKFAEALEDGPVLAETLAHVGPSDEKFAPWLSRKASSPDPVVRAAALRALAVLRLPEAAALSLKLIHDPDIRVRRIAAWAAGQLQVREAADVLLERARDRDPESAAASLEALRLLREPRVVPLAAAALTQSETAPAALACLEDLGTPDQAKAVGDLAHRQQATEILVPALRLLSQWAEKYPEQRSGLQTLTAEIQGASGVLGAWRISGGLDTKESADAIDRLARGKVPPAASSWTPIFGEGTEARVVLKGKARSPHAVWLAFTDFDVPQALSAQLLAGSAGPLRVWIDGRRVFERAGAGTGQPDRFDVSLAAGRHRLIVETAPSKDIVSFHLRFRAKSSSAKHEQLTQLALSQPGSPERGRKLFFDVGKSQCLKCHRLQDQGERIGPDLTGIGKRFGRVYLIESILEPSRAIAPSYESVLVELKDGRVVTGLRVAENDATLTFADREGKKHELPRALVESQRPQPQSIMPEGLEQQLTADEFVDLIAFLASRK